MTFRNGEDTITVDAVVVGAGFGGLRMLHELRQLGKSVQVIETASDVGGTWYWNRYPGARTDSESWIYAYYFSKELQEDWDWAERFPAQPETLRYLQHVADRFDMRKDIEFSTRVNSAVYDEQTNTWTVVTDKGQTYTCTYFISAVGLLTVPYKPNFPGIDDFTGDWYFTGRWPKEGVDFTGKRVAVIGAGATAVQAVPIIAKTAEHLTMFQRTPNYVMPARNYILTPEERQGIRTDYENIWDLAKQHFFGFAMEPAGRLASQASPEEQQRVLEAGWEAGGFRFIFETFDDILVDETSNEVAAEFVRNKIRAIVKDPETAELLCPKDYPLAGKRPPLGNFYYETFNRDNVSLVDVSNSPITEITANGIRTETGEYDADIIVFATGFDAVTGSVTGMDIRGRNGLSLRDKWKDGPLTHLGICVEDFPNMFMLSGPQSPFANIPVVIEGSVEWISHTLTHMGENNLASIEPTAEAVQNWRQHVNELVNATVLSKGKNSWLMGDNIPGKAHEVLFFFGGAGLYRQECQQVIEQGYPGFAFSDQSERALV
ncbi:flavin-containing monooxygenase [Rhodococcus opacus]|uniref:flavin-containing monooxygenase n=1 Tax=Rhodococcus opacus TaxID=37919 RepID=UPI002473CBD2|nr:NAD(P)/FAD-dependent oxidoreductase [Rhodococcus opacus]MDH6291993.1 cation diffusion facilitator CzcD-associated flavoprotein CzcO [Rhodococcus opacus]